MKLLYIHKSCLFTLKVAHNLSYIPAMVGDSLGQGSWNTEQQQSQSFEVIITGNLCSSLLSSSSSSRLDDLTMSLILAFVLVVAKHFFVQSVNEFPLSLILNLIVRWILEFRVQSKFDLHISSLSSDSGVAATWIITESCTTIGYQLHNSLLHTIIGEKIELYIEGSKQTT